MTMEEENCDENGCDSDGVNEVSYSSTEKHADTGAGKKQSAADSRWRFACMEENDHIRKIYEERPYQVEIVEKALRQNTIVCLGTGTGKTFISATVIKEMQGGIEGTYNTNGKRTVFLVNTVPLVFQQAQVIASMTCLNVGLYTGDMGVDLWNKDKWREQFNKHDVLVMTCQILVNILTHAFIGLRNINLLIFDECHNATKKHPYAQILEFHDKCPVDEQPHILGLTASIINKKYKRRESSTKDIRNFLLKNMKLLEAKMRSKCVTCSDQRAAEEWAAKPIEMIKVYPMEYLRNGFADIHEMANPEGRLVKNLSDASKKFKLLQKENEGTAEEVIDLLLAEIELLEEDAKGKLAYGSNILSIAQGTLKAKDILLISADAVKYCADIICELGPLCGYEAAKILIKQLSKHKELTFKQKDKEVLEECINLLDDVKATFESCVLNTEFKKVKDVKPMEPFISKKANTFLKDVILQEKQHFLDVGTELHAIVFVERRCTAVILDKLINFQARAEKEMFGGIKSRYVLGHGLIANVQLADSNMKSVDQNKVIKEFKSGVFNILVATSVIEEGLDVRKCNLVVRFDGMGNYRQYVQSKGRARVRCTGTKFIIMTSEENEKQAKLDLEIMQEMESLLNEMCQEERGLPSKEEIADAMIDEEEERIPTYFAHDGPDAARINHHSAVGLVHRYCSMLPRDLYSSTCPHFEYESRGTGGDREFQATLYLPMNFPLEEKVYKSEWFSEKETCKKCVSLLVCIALHTGGELDSNLLPVRHTKEDSDFEEDRDEMKPKEGTRKSQDYYHRKFPDVLSPEVLDLEKCELFVISIALIEPRDRPSSIALRPFWYGKEKKGFGILLPPGIPTDLPPIKVYTRAGGILITFVHLENDNSVINVKNSSLFHCAMMDICAGKHISGKYIFDINDQRVSKGLLVPLESIAFQAIEPDSKVHSHHKKLICIDVEGIDNYVNCVGDIGRDNDQGFNNAIINKTYLNEQQNRRLYYIAGFSDQQGKDIMEGDITYSIYYSTKYNHIIDDDAYLLEAVPCPSRVNFSEDLAKKDCTKQSTYKPERLVPELCKKAYRTHAHLHQQLNLLPYTFYMFESILNAYELRKKISEKLNISHDETILPDKKDIDLSESSQRLLENMLRQSNVIDKKTFSPTIMEILETLTTRQAKFPYDLERLEMLGDSFLKQAVSVYLFFKYPKAHEGTLSSKRKRCISNKNLCRIAKSKDVGIQHVICNSQFGNVNPGNENQNSLTVWLPPGYYRVEDDSVDNSGCNNGNETEIVKNVVEYLVQVVEKTVEADELDSPIFNGQCNVEELNMNLEMLKVSDVNHIDGPCHAKEGSLLEVSVCDDKSVSKSDSDSLSDECPPKETSNCVEEQSDNDIVEKPNEETQVVESVKDELPINISKDLPYQLVQDKSLADCIEALIGLYFKVGGTNLALHFMQEFLSIDVLFAAIPEKDICRVQIGSQSEYADFPKQSSAIQNPRSTYSDVEILYEQMKLNRLEEILGYEFKDKSFLVQAMTHLSYRTNDVTGCYQQLEFLGDAILDFLVTLHIYMYKPDLSPGELTSLRSALVNNNTFGLLVIKFEWHKFLKHYSPKLHNVCMEFLNVANDSPCSLDSCFENPFVIVRENSEEGFHAPKVLGDIFESIAGAVFVDSHLNLVETWKIFYPFMKEIIDKYMEKIPLNPIREFHEKYTSGCLSYAQIDDEMVVCTATYGNNKTKTGMGKNKRIAKATVCHKAVYGG